MGFPYWAEICPCIGEEGFTIPDRAHHIGLLFFQSIGYRHTHPYTHTAYTKKTTQLIMYSQKEINIDQVYTICAPKNLEEPHGPPPPRALLLPNMFDASVISDHWWIAEPRDVTAQPSPSCDLCLGDVERLFAAGQSVAVRRVVSGEKKPHLLGLPRKAHQKNDHFGCRGMS